MTTLTVALIVVTWVLVGLVTGLWMIRRGHESTWLLIAAVLGPLFVPIAWERVERRPRAPTSPKGDAAATEPSGGLRALVGVDGSPESEHAVDTAVRLLGDRLHTLLLAEVVPFEAADRSSGADLDAASNRLAKVAGRAETAGVPVRYQVLGGPPGETLRRLAEEQDFDVLVVGRRGRGLSARLLGSVSEDLVRHSAVSVLVVEPRRDIRS